MFLQEIFSICLKGRTKWWGFSNNLPERIEVVARDKYSSGVWNACARNIEILDHCISIQEKISKSNATN